MGTSNLEGSTHICVRNDENTRRMLLDVLRGEVGLFFETAEKDD